MSQHAGMFTDLIASIEDETLKEKVGDKCYHLVITETNTTRGGKNPYQGSYESQEASINFSTLKLPKADLPEFKTMDKADVALVSYATQYSYLIELLVCNLITKEKYKTQKDAMIANTIFILKAVLRD